MKGLTLAGSPAGTAAADDTTTDERAEPLAPLAGACCCVLCLEQLPNDNPLDVALQTRAVPAGAAGVSKLCAP